MFCLSLQRFPTFLDWSLFLCCSLVQSHKGNWCCTHYINYSLLRYNSELSGTISILSSWKRIWNSLGFCAGRETRELGLSHTSCCEEMQERTRWGSDNIPLFSPQKLTHIRCVSAQCVWRESSTDVMECVGGIPVWFLWCNLDHRLLLRLRLDDAAPP